MSKAMKISELESETEELQSLKKDYEAKIAKQNSKISELEANFSSNI
jgi:hypothetical protein